MGCYSDIRRTKVQAADNQRGTKQTGMFFLKEIKKRPKNVLLLTK